MKTLSETRPAAVAGSFYPATRDALRATVVGMLEGVAHEERRCPGAIVPHAGLEYSGQCAAEVIGRIHVPGTVVILAPNHTGTCRSPGASLWAHGAFTTPLGDVPVNESLAARLVGSCDLIAHDPAAHAREHAVEVELPFLQARAPDVSIVPLVLAFEDWRRCEILGRALADAVNEEADEVLLLASSDMSHFEPAAVAAKKDGLALEAVRRLDGEALLAVCRRERITMCGRAAAACALEASRLLGAAHGEVIDYRHSGLVTGDDSSVVAYAGVILA